MAVSVALIPRATFGTHENEIFSLRFDEKDRFIATGGYDGRVRVYSAISGQLLNEFLHVGSRTEFERVPIATCVRWRPSESGTRGILLSTHTDGAINYWYPAGGKLVHQLQEGSDIYALDTSRNGEKFATASSDFKVRLYDLQSQAFIGEMTPLGPTAPGHSSRVFSLKFTEDGNVLLSGGWDSTIHVWDARTQHAIGALLGPYMCGDALDFRGDTVLAGAWQSKQQLQLFSLRKMSRFAEISWRFRQDDVEDESHVYAAQFSKRETDFVLAGGSRNNEARLFEASGRRRPVATVAEVPKSVYCVDFANNSQSAAIGSGDGCVRVFDYSLIHS